MYNHQPSYPTRRLYIPLPDTEQGGTMGVLLGTEVVLQGVSMVVMKAVPRVA